MLELQKLGRELLILAAIERHMRMPGKQLRRLEMLTSTTTHSGHLRRTIKVEAANNNQSTQTKERPAACVVRK